VLIGANPDWAKDLCHRSSAASVCEQILRREFRAQPRAHDARIKAAVIADPPGFFFTADGFAAVKMPVQLWASEREGRGLRVVDPGITPESVAAVDRSLTAEREYHVMPNAGHFAFQFICPPAVAKAVPEICTDAPGFDRAAFPKRFNAAVLVFFREHLVNR
jgi:predicted dienelactone hydrolase